MHLGNVTARKWKDSTKNADNNPVGFHVPFCYGFLLNKTREEEAGSGCSTASSSHFELVRWQLFEAVIKGTTGGT